MKYYPSEITKTNLVKCSSCAFYLLYLVIAPRYFLEQLLKQKIKELKSDCQFYE